MAVNRQRLNLKALRSVPAFKRWATCQAGWNRGLIPSLYRRRGFFIWMER